MLVIREEARFPIIQLNRVGVALDRLRIPDHQFEFGGKPFAHVTDSTLDILREQDVFKHPLLVIAVRRLSVVDSVPFSFD